MSARDQEKELRDFVFSMPTKVIFGMDKTDSVGKEASQLGRHALLLAAAETMEKIGALKRVRESLADSGVKVTTFDDVQANPTVAAIDKAADLCRRERCDLVVGLGGGSAIDFAKGVAVMATHEGFVWDYVGRVDHEPKPITAETLPIIAIPTTSGTGAEVTSVAVITNPDTHEKSAIAGSCIIPKVAVVDPSLTLSLPPRLTASTGFDAFAHALEAYVSRFTTPVSDLVALEAIRLVAANLTLAVNQKNNIAARKGMAWAATLGGIAISNAGMTVVHGIAQALGGHFNIGHGETVAFCLPEVMERTWEVKVDRFARVSEAMGTSVRGMSTEESAKACVEGIKGLRKEVGLDSGLKEFGVSPTAIDQLVTDVFGYLKWSVDGHPKELNPEDVKAILQVCMSPECSSTRIPPAFCVGKEQSCVMRKRKTPW